MGFDTGDSASPVIPLVVGEDMTAFMMTIRLAGGRRLRQPGRLASECPKDGR